MAAAAAVTSSGAAGPTGQAQGVVARRQGGVGACKHAVHRILMQGAEFGNRTARPTCARQPSYPRPAPPFPRSPAIKESDIMARGTNAQARGPTISVALRNVGSLSVEASFQALGGDLWAV